MENKKQFAFSVAIKNHFTTNDRQAYVLAANEIKQLFTNNK